MPLKLDPQSLGRRAEAMLFELAAISAEPARLVRLYLSPEYRRAADLVARWMREAGAEVFEDALGNVRGRLGPAPRLLIGSHIETVIDAGRYDGPLGVVAAILAVDAFARANAKPAFGIELVAFGDEEASRFPTTLSTSAALAGHFDKNTLNLKDSAGVTYAEALRAYGKNPDDVASVALTPGEASAYVELHIEQGPVLEAENQPLGIVTAMAGQTRLSIEVKGEAGHAGTVPMNLRRDALAGAAEMTLAAENIARGGMVATVGIIEAKPGAVNIIPGTARFTIDLRDASDTARKKAIADFRTECGKIAARRKLAASFTLIHEIPTTPCDPRLQDQLASAIEAVGGKPIRMPSGAGHDGMSMAKLCPIAMMFVRCKGGVSHNPAEYASPHDMGLAVAALVRFVENFKPPR
ncbi:MAG TPA: allantoate amidohydrolase [Xanthobacteraceae bacterium]|nr:allantoate amidohydrolase [Xanthobacteraceae bacterium]